MHHLPALSRSAALAVVLIACTDTSGSPSQPDANTEAPVETTRSVLLVILDDVGLDASAQYDVGDLDPSTPTLDALAADGLVFDNAWATPTCSPTRAAALTGRHGFRNGVLSAGQVLGADETTLQAHLGDAVATAVIGKWHLGGRDNPSHPNDVGVDHFAGTTGAGVDDYENWTLVEDGVESQVTNYATTEVIDRAIDWVHDQPSSWFLQVAFQAAHTPFHRPPDALHSQDLDTVDLETDPLPFYLAAVEAMDTELARLLEVVPEDTLILVIGDNGTPTQATQRPVPARRAKGTLYQGGVQVPFIAYGPDVTRPGEREDALVMTVDLFPTIAQALGVPATTTLDGSDLGPLLAGTEGWERTYAYTETGGEGGGWALRDLTHKLIVYDDDTRELFDLSIDPYERTELLAGGGTAMGIAESLEAAAEAIRQ